jgi:hypothetical protein
MACPTFLFSDHMTPNGRMNDELERMWKEAVLAEF